MTLRTALFSLASGGLLVAACSKKVEPVVTPPPVETTTPTPAPPPPPPPPPSTEPTCEQVITRMVSELAALVHFDTDKADIRPGDATVLDGKASVLQSHPQVRVRITGHADERYTAEYNLVLGTKRAESAKGYLVSKGVGGGRIETASLGETAPLDPGHTEAAWSRNRRAEVSVIAGRNTLASHLARCQ